MRLYARVENPNSFGLTLTRLAGGFSLDGHHAADVDFPLGLPLRAGEAVTVPLDVSIRFSELPGLAGVATRLLAGSPVDYELEGTVAVDAGPFGEPRFGPMRILSGEVRRR